MAALTDPLSTIVRNTAGVARFFAFLGEHGIQLAAGEDYVHHGDLLSRWINDPTQFGALNYALTHGLLTILRAPAVYVYDETNDVGWQLTANNGVVVLQDPDTGSYSGGFTPAQLTPTFWLDGRQPAFSDTGATTPATSPAGRVRRIDGPAPLGGQWLAASDTVRPFREASAVDCHAGAGLNLGTPGYPNSITLPAGDATVGLSFTLRDTLDITYEAVFLGDDGVSTWGIVVFGGQILIYRNNTSWSTGVILPSLTPVSLVARWRGVAGCDLIYSVDGGDPVTLSDATAAPVRTTYGLSVGGANNQLHGVVSQVVAVGQAVSDDERTHLLTFLVANSAPTEFPDDAPLVVVAGDSIARGYSVARQSGWAYAMLPNLYGTAAVRQHNVAVSGYTIAQVDAIYATQILPLYNADRSRNILILAVGTNSLAEGSGLTAAQCLTQYYALADKATADGFRVILHHAGPRSDGSFGGSGYNSRRATFNADVSANYGVHAFGLANTAAVVGMGADGDEVNTDNYIDRVHPTPVGHGLLEPTYRAAVIVALGDVPAAALSFHGDPLLFNGQYLTFTE